MPEKDKHRITVYLTDDNYQSMSTYISSNYAPMKTYGAMTEVVNTALSYYYATSDMRSGGYRTFNTTEDLFKDLDKPEEKVAYEERMDKLKKELDVLDRSGNKGG